MVACCTLQYDHLEFSGVVPRSFVGPLAVSIFAAPVVQLIDLLSLGKFLSQYVGKYLQLSLILLDTY